MTLLAGLVIAALTIFTVVDAFTNPPTRRPPVPPAEPEYWPGYLRELEMT